MGRGEERRGLSPNESADPWNGGPECWRHMPRKCCVVGQSLPRYAKAWAKVSRPPAVATWARKLFLLAQLCPGLSDGGIRENSACISLLVDVFLTDATLTAPEIHQS